MDIEKMKENWQRQEQDVILSSVKNDHIFQKAKFEMHKFERFFSFASGLCLITGMVAVILNISFALLMAGTSIFSIADLTRQLPYWFALIVIFYSSKTKIYHASIQGFIKGSLMKIRVVIIAAAVYIIYTAAILFNNWDGFYKVLSTNSTIFVLSIIMHILIIAYTFYLYLTMIKPVYSGLRSFNKSISSL